MIQPLKTDKEKLVWQEIWKQSGNGKCYALVDELYEATGVNKRSMPGVIRSLQEKGWVYAFGEYRYGCDLEVTCMAIIQMEGKVRKTRSCNHENCHCNAKWK